MTSQPSSQLASPQQGPGFKSIFFGGLLPIAAFALVEHYYGTLGGVIAGVAFGMGELGYEYHRFGKVQGITIVANLLVVGLGGLSLFEDDPVFFKLQPAILIFVFAGILLGSSLIGKPFLVEASKKQMPHAPDVLRESLGRINFRLGICMLALGALSVYAAYAWSTAAWAALKAVGAPVVMVVYMGVEILIIRARIRKRGSE